MQSIDLQVKDKENLSSFAALGILFCFIFGFLTTHEVSIQNSLQLCAILALDLLTGAVIWILLSRKDEYSIFELLGVGVALGTSLNAICQLVFRETILASLFNYLFLVFVVLLFVQFRSKKQFVARLSPTRSSTVLAVCTTALILLCGDRYYLWIGVLILAIALFVLIKFEHSPSSNKFQSLFFVFSLGSVALALLSSSILENFLFGPRSTTSYIGGWDGVYAEASSKSITNYGPFDNIFLANTKNAYYWFSYAWSGSITDRSKTSDWIVTTQFGYVLVALATMFIVFAVLQSVSKNKPIGFIPLAVVATTSLIGSSNFLLDTGSFSQCVSILYLALTFFATKELLENSIVSNILLAVLSISLLALTKLTVAIPLIFGLCLFVLLIWFVDVSKKQKISVSLAVLVSGISSLAIFFVFISQQGEFQNSQSEFVITAVSNAFGIGTGFLLIDIGLLILLKFPIFYGQFRNLNMFASSIAFVILASFSMSILISSSWVNQANTYLLLPFSFGAGLLISIHLSQDPNLLGAAQPKGRIPVYFATAIGGGLGFVTTALLFYFHQHFVTNARYYLVVSLIPLISVIPVSVFSFINSTTKKFKNTFVSLITVVFLATSAGSYFAHSLREVERQIVFEKNDWDLPVEEVGVPNRNLQGAITFISNSFDVDDVLADNSSDNILIAAGTGFRSYASTYGRSFSIAHDERLFAQSKFAQTPNLSDYEYLRNGCVTWFYYDKDESPGKAKSFEPYAKTKYEDEHGAVLKLSESYPLPDECFK
jgi:hypothetical protein